MIIKDLVKNLILINQKQFKEEKVNLNVKVKLIVKIMQLNIFNLMKVIMIQYKKFQINLNKH